MQKPYWSRVGFITQVRDFMGALSQEAHALGVLAPSADGGTLEYDFQASKHRCLSLSFGKWEGIPYAWIYDGESGHGVEQFDGDTISPELTALIERMVAGLSEEAPKYDEPSRATHGAIAMARNFMDALSREAYVLGVLTPNDDGVTLDYNLQPSLHRCLSITFGNGRIPYAWIYDGESGYGYEAFDGEHISAELTALIERMVASHE